MKLHRRMVHTVDLDEVADVRRICVTVPRLGSS
jgi:hypothetical protein